MILRRLLRTRFNTVAARISIIALLAMVWAYGWMSNVANLIVWGQGTIVTGIGEGGDSRLADVGSRLVLIGFACALAASLWFGSARKGQRDTVRLIIALMPAVVLIGLSNPLQGIAPTQVQVFAYVAVTVALWLYGPDRAILIAVLGFVVVGAATSVVLGLCGIGALTPSNGVAVDKALVFDSLLAGIYNYNNPLGASIAAVAPLLLLIRRRWVSGSLALLLAFCLIWTGSRTAMLATGVIVVAGAILWLLRDKPRLRSIIASAGLFAVGAAVLALPIVVQNYPRALSARGLMWEHIFDIWQRSAFFGLGRNAFAPEGELAVALGHSYSHGHNLFMTILLTTGIVGVITVGALFVLLSIVAVRALAHSLVPYLLVIGIVTLSLMETPGNFFPFERMSTTTFVIWVVFAFVFWSRNDVGFRQAVAVAPRVHGSDADRSTSVATG